MTAARLFAAAGLAACAAFLALPAGGVAQALVFTALDAAALGALWHRKVRGHLPGPLWTVLAAAQTLYLGATLGWYLYPLATGTSWVYPSPLDAAFWVSYAGWAVFLVGLTRRRARSDRGVAWEAIAAGLAVVVVAWPTLLEPALRAAGAGTAAGVASVLYPGFLVLLAAIGVRLAMVSPRASLADALVVAWLTAELAGDVWYSLASAGGSFRFGHPMFVSWMLSYAAFGTMALQPDLPRLGQTEPDERLLRPGARAGALGAGVALAVLALASQAPPGRRWGVAFMAAGTVAAMGLVLYRLAAATRDLSAERRLHAELAGANAELAHAATHDALTGVANRFAFEACLGRMLARRHAPGRAPCLCLIDVDALKAVNDTHGHAAGDALLRAAAARLEEAVRPGDLVARLGGDEFAVVLDGADPRTLLALGDRLVASLKEPVAVGASLLAPSASVGLHVVAPEESAGDAMSRADAALYAAKQSGGGAVLFDASRFGRLLDRYQLELDLRVAVARGELVLHYQPVVELASRRVVKAEALLRWDHPVRGRLDPGSFIAIAETSGAIVEIGRWVLHRACRDARCWQDLPGGAGVGVAVNVSRRQLQSASVEDDVRDAIAGARLDPGLLTVEVTESALMTETAEMVARLERIRGLGVEVAMDDFGTGYSSLAHLRSLPVDLLKIDKAFVAGIADEEEEWAIAAAVLRLARSLQKRTLAEGVERASQLAHLRTLGCEYGQGWLFGRPAPLEEFTASIAGRTDPRLACAEGDARRPTLTPAS